MVAMPPAVFNAPPSSVATFFLKVEPTMSRVFKPLELTK